MHKSVLRASQRVEGDEMNCVCGETLLKPDASMLHCDSCDDWYTKGTYYTKSVLGFQWL